MTPDVIELTAKNSCPKPLSGLPILMLLLIINIGDKNSNNKIWDKNFVFLVIVLIKVSLFRVRKREKSHRKYSS